MGAEKFIENATKGIGKFNWAEIIDRSFSSYEELIRLLEEGNTMEKPNHVTWQSFPLIWSFYNSSTKFFIIIFSKFRCVGTVSFSPTVDNAKLSDLQQLHLSEVFVTLDGWEEAKSISQAAKIFFLSFFIYGRSEFKKIVNIVSNRRPLLLKWTVWKISLHFPRHASNEWRYAIEEP